MESGTKWNAERWKTPFGRVVKRIGAQELALLVGLDKSTVYNWLNGRTEPRREMAELLVAIAKERSLRLSIASIHKHLAAAKNSRRPAEPEVTSEAN